MSADRVDALFCLSTRCPHCPAMLGILGDLVKAGRLGRLEVVNLEVYPEIAGTLGVRSVPWVRLGRFEFAGLRTRAELEQWIVRATHPDAMADYLHAQLRDGHFADVVAMVRRDPEALSALLPIVANPEASINVRIGAGGVFEEFAGQVPMQQLTDRLGALSRHADPRVRADACHYLSLTGSPSARPYLRERLADEDVSVREIAAESLEALPE